MDWRVRIRRRVLASWPRTSTARASGAVRRCWLVLARPRSSAALFAVLGLLFAAALPLAGREKDKLTYGEGLLVNIPAPESEVARVVEEVAQNGVIRGTKEYNKDEFIAGAKAATSSRVFPAWTEGGKVFYKVREQALDPRNFKDANDVGTLVVRYVVQPQGQKNTVLHIDALFEEDFRHGVHQSDGSVENAEFKDIQEHIEAIEVMKQQNVEAEHERQEQLAKKQNPAIRADAQAGTARLPYESPESATPQSASTQSAAQAVPGMENREDAGSPAGITPSADPAFPNPGVPGQSLEDRVKDLRKQVERLVKAPGAPLKSAPFHTASTLQSLTPGTEVLILISTPYWYGIETHEGQHGWIMRDQLEQP